MGYPYNTTESNIRFFVPPTLPGDFDNFLAIDIPGAVMNFQVIHDWYEQDEEDYEPYIVRGEIYPEKSKSRYANTDNNLNFRTSVRSEIQKGDILIDEDNMIYLLDWDIPPQPNNKMSRALRCNAKITFTRFNEDEYDDEGLRIDDESDRKITIAAEIPVNAYRYDGRPEFSAISATPGIAPNALTLMSVQYNDQTKEIRAGDNFVWGGETYIVVDVGYAGVSIDETHGVLSVQSKKEAGGSVGY